MPAADLLRDYELLLVRKHRFALADIVVCMQRVVQDLQQLQRRLQRAVSLVPSFLGETELRTLLSALQEFWIWMQHLAKFLDEAGQVLQNSHSRRVGQYEKAIEQFTDDFKLALEDEHLKRARQLHFDIETIETSMSTMLLPHFEICRTITTANAQVQPTRSLFSRADCDDIDAFVQTAAKLKSGGITFRSVLQHAQEFLKRLTLFEQAAKKDAFLVCSSALKLQFRESLDQELFLAYVNDWGTKRKALQV
ncbi:hypothetical protein PHYSODRAFT_470490 [Phytophthora sojae]|uniref:Uncharacterized protein n=1 Tax=Phytophthora sojae (strain P6497) TaxID=1094619 RepID=G4YJM7_PHYSP|nr:hypothetical protein PHYSODRAFT_470490 [Phytophthora sojae]EGZ30139.1 hypothetical protein PHYSODRAFT_470490 [Phytophthora sojae]|eukprot:XP_009517414.1 hypothetical protein PHYSODRAFT_470490 [Phytophthora sojae]